MARSNDQFRSSDVTTWGMVALVCGGLAVLSANISALVPESVFTGLHTSRLDGGTINQLRAQVANLQADAARAQRDANALLSRFSRIDQSNSSMAARVSALEVALPSLLEARSIAAEAEDVAGPVDATDTTASIGDGGPVTYEVDGGTVTVQRRPMDVPTAPAAAQPMQPMPPLAVEPSAADEPGAIGIALGGAVGASETSAAWGALNTRVGTLLLGLSPLLVDAPDGVRKRIVAGPLSDQGEAEALCRAMMRVGIECEPVPYTGLPLPAPLAAAGT